MVLIFSPHLCFAIIFFTPFYLILFYTVLKRLPNAVAWENLGWKVPVTLIRFLHISNQYFHVYWYLPLKLACTKAGKETRCNYTIMLRAILNKSWQQHPTRNQLYGHLPPITKTIQVRRTRHAGHCWRSRDELIRDVLLWIPTHGRAKAGRPARTYIQQLCEDTGCCLEDLSGAMNDREEWRERVRDIRATSTIWWWWYIYIYISWLNG